MGIGFVVVEAFVYSPNQQGQGVRLVLQFSRASVSWRPIPAFGCRQRHTECLELGQIGLKQVEYGWLTAKKWPFLLNTSLNNFCSIIWLAPCCCDAFETWRRPLGLITARQWRYDFDSFTPSKNGRQALI